MDMTRWEYLFIDGEHEKDDWRPKTSNGRELSDWKHGPAIHDYANDLGREGWELVWSQRVLVPVGHEDRKLHAAGLQTARLVGTVIAVAGAGACALEPALLCRPT